MTTQKSNHSPEFCELGHVPTDYQNFADNCQNVRNWPDWGRYTKPGEAQEMHVGECLGCKSTISYPPPALRDPSTRELKAMGVDELRATAENRSISPRVRGLALRSWSVLDAHGLSDSNLCTWSDGAIVAVPPKPGCFTERSGLSPSLRDRVEMIQNYALGGLVGAS